MRKRHLAILLLFSPVTAKPQTPNQLELRAEIKSERYCEVDNEISSLLVKFKFRLVNNGKAPAVIPQRTGPLLLVSRTLTDLQRSKHEFELNPPDYFAPPTTKPERRVIMQGEVFESEMESAIPTPKTAKYSKRIALAPGMHYLQVVITVQLEGTLRFVDAVSQPINITIAKFPKTEICQ